MQKLFNQSILFVSLPRHDERYTSTTWQLATELAEENDVFFIDHPFTFLELITRFRHKAIRQRLKSYWREVSFWKNSVEVIHAPFVWPTNFLPKGRVYNFFSKVNQRIVANRINRFLKMKRLPHLIYVNSFDFYFPDLQRYLSHECKVKVYHCIDPMVKPFTRKHGESLQRRAASSADLIICTAPFLQRQFQHKSYPPSYLVPNAANFSLFNKAMRQGNKTLQAIEQIEGKVMGYLGNIERRIDFELLQQVVNRLPDWQLVMAGPFERAIVPSSLLNHPRIHFIGLVPHQEAPALLKRLDVALIPFVCSESAQGIYPLKLYEYLAAGKPVVSTNFNPEVLGGLTDQVEVADLPLDFADKVQTAYESDSDDKIKQRVAIAARNSWQQRAEQFGEYIAAHLNEI